METELKSIDSVGDIGDYLHTFGGALAKKCNDTLDPLHMPGRDPLPDFSEYKRQPYEAQAHLIAANIRLLDEVGAGFINGEVGCGKSISATMIVHEHAKKRGLKGYRCIVMCPDHLIEKWKQKEILPTLPDVDIIILDKWWEFLDLCESKAKIGEAKHWPKAERPTWIIVGRNQIKHGPATKGIGAESTKRLMEAEKNKDGTKGERVIVQRSVCPKCGLMIMDKDKPMSLNEVEKKTLRCTGLYLDEVGGNDRISMTTRHKPDHKCEFPHEHRTAKVGQVVDHAGKKWEVKSCDEPLWSWTGKPRRWPAARIIHQRLKGWADYLVLDEAHEAKSGTSARSMAFGKVLASTKYCLSLTGTLTGGRADHLFPLCLRMNPADVIDRGFEWGRETPWAQAYGCVDTVVTSKGPVPGSEIAEGSRSMRKQSLEKISSRDAIRPGIMPSLFPDIVMHQTTFLRLDQFMDDLPGLTPHVEPIAMGFAQKNEYDRIASILKTTNAKMLSEGNQKLLGATLWTLLSYPDYPWGWQPMFPDAKAMHKRHAVGWWLIPKLMSENNYTGVVSPLCLDWDFQLPKEKRLIEICKANLALGDQTWVYVQLTNKHDCRERLKQQLEAAGLRVGVLVSDEVEPRDRFEWIKKTGPKVDVMISHPTCVATGLDFFDFSNRANEFNFNHIVFYQTGYEPFILRQAAGRARRIGQPKDCTVTYLYYEGTMQESAMVLAGRKAAAALQLEEGRVDDEGLAGMGGGGNAQAALVKAIGENIDPSEIKLRWGRVQNPGSRVRRTPLVGVPAQPGRPSVEGDATSNANTHADALPMQAPPPTARTRKRGVPVHGVPEPKRELPVVACPADAPAVVPTTEAMKMAESVMNFMALMRRSEKPAKEPKSSKPKLYNPDPDSPWGDW